MNSASLKIKSGNAMVYYCFDIANEIDVDNIETIFGQKPEKKRHCSRKADSKLCQIF